jgi:hypothetical protein
VDLRRPTTAHDPKLPLQQTGLNRLSIPAG